MFNILLYKGHGLISKLIKWQTRSKYSHAAIKIGDIVYESTGAGVTKRLYGTKYDKQADLFSFNFPISSEQIIKAQAFLDKQVGKGYDYRMIMRFLTHQNEHRRSRNKWFCSELVFAALKKAGIDLLARTDPWEVSPVHIFKSPLLIPETKK